LPDLELKVWFKSKDPDHLDSGV